MIKISRIALLTGLAFVGWQADLGGRVARAQDPTAEIERPAPPALDDLETDENQDGVPDGWYNQRDARLVSEGGVIGPKFIRFESNKPSRPARLSRAFGVDGTKYEAIIIGMWIRVDQIQSGERLGEEPQLLIDFLGDKLRHASRGTMGPWTMRNFSAGNHWTRVVKRIPVPPEAHDAIMSVGLLGATGIMDMDGVTFELVEIGGEETTNLAVNPDFELGDPQPTGWLTENGARRVFPGFQSRAAVELARTGARAISGLGIPVAGLPSLAVTLRVRGQGLRGSGGAAGAIFFVDEQGREIGGGATAFRWSGTFDWRQDRAEIPVPPGAVNAVIQFEKSDGLGSIRIDDLEVTCATAPAAATWIPFHVEDDTTRWLKVTPSTAVEPGSALDFAFLLDGPAGAKGPVVVKSATEGATRRDRLYFSKGDRARFFGVQLLPPTGFLEPSRAEALADRLARSGVNLVRLGDLDTPLGPARSLFDDTKDDTLSFDPESLERLDHLLAALKKRGIYYALELQAGRRFRSEDGVAMPGALPAGGGPAAVFDPTIKKLADDAAKRFLAHVNPETGQSYHHDPALAWVTLAGELTLFDLVDNPSALPADYAKELRELAAKSTVGSGRRFWQATETARWKELADSLRKDGLKAPIAAVSHWRRDEGRDGREFTAMLASPEFDLIDDRVYWFGPSWGSARFRSAMWGQEGGLVGDANRKRRVDRPYVVGQWCDYTKGVWAYPHEAAEQLLAAATAMNEDWDGLVRRGVFLHPDPWGLGPAGTSGGEDIFQVAEVANAAPQVYALWPHAASLYLRGDQTDENEPGREKGKTRREPVRRGRPTARGRRTSPVPNWEPERGRLIVDTPYTQGLAGWPGGEPAVCENLTFETENPYAVLVASSVGKEPIGRSKRLLVTAVARVTATGFRWVDEWRRDTADPGRPPLLAEPVVGQVTWNTKGTVKGFVLDNNGRRVRPARLRQEQGGDAWTLLLDGTAASQHFELVLE